MVIFLHWNKKFIIPFVITTFILVMPFFLLNPHNFIYQTIYFYFQNPPHPSLNIHSSLNLNTLYFVFIHQDLPVLLVYGTMFFVFIFSIFYKKNQYLPFFRFTLILFAVFVFGRQAFVNYYYLICSLIILNQVITNSLN